MERMRCDVAARTTAVMAATFRCETGAVSGGSKTAHDARKSATKGMTARIDLTSSSSAAPSENAAGYLWKCCSHQKQEIAPARRGLQRTIRHVVSIAR